MKLLALSGRGGSNEVMNQENNNPSELEIKLSSIAIDAVMKAAGIELSPQELQEFKEQTIKDAKAIANEYDLDSKADL